MKKLTVVAALALVCILALTGCQCKHEWEDATCKAPNTCALCGETVGKALGHDWVDATCTTPKTCETCKTTKGDALGHKWQDATPEAPKTCETCGATEGEPLKPTISPDVQAKNELVGRWENATTYNAENLGLTDMTGTYTEIYSYTFREDGTVSACVEIDNIDECKTLMIAATIQELYALFDSEAEANQAMQDEYNMTVEEYAAQYCEDYLEETQNTVYESTYSIEDDKLSIEDDWGYGPATYDFYIEDDVLRLIDSEGDHLDLNRA